MPLCRVKGPNVNQSPGSGSLVLNFSVVTTKLCLPLQFLAYLNASVSLFGLLILIVS